MRKRKARRLRKLIEMNRCPVRPGIIHKWQLEAHFDPTSFGSVVEWWECTKCGKVDR